MAVGYNEMYWRRVKADPARLAVYRARRNKNQNARRAREREERLRPSPLEQLILGCSPESDTGHKTQ